MPKAFEFSDALSTLDVLGRYRERRCLSGPQGTDIHIDGRQVLSFCSNDYLGLASHPRVVEAFCRAAETCGVGSGASHLLTGHHALHHELEERLAAFSGRPRALLFSSGYAANLGIISTLLGRHDVIVQDKLNHASLLDGARLSGASLKRYAHNDPEALEVRLRSVQSEQHCLVVTDGVFSMDGDTARLPLFAQMATRYNAWLMVDDAHGFGVLGAGGRGTPAHLGCQDHVPVYMATLGKALGVGGAFVAGDDAFIEYLIQKARTYIYTTALPPAMAAATLASLTLLEDEAWRLERLQSLVAYWRRGALRRGIPLLPSETPIQPLILGRDAKAVAVSQALLQRNILVAPIRPPTVPEGESRLRITLSASHTEQQLDRLLDALEEILAEVPAA